MNVTYTHPEIKKPITVFVHEVTEENGIMIARVNKGEVKTVMTFKVPVAYTDLVVI